MGMAGDGGGNNSAGNGYGGGQGNGQGGSSYGNGNSAYAVVTIAGLNGQPLTLAEQEVEDSTMAELYITKSGRKCTKAEVLAAARALADFTANGLKNALKGRDPLIQKDIINQIAAYFSGETPVDLECGLFPKPVSPEASFEVAQKKNSTISNQCYISAQGRICSQEQVRAATKRIEGLSTLHKQGLLADDDVKAIIVNHFFEEEPLDCAFSDLIVKCEEAEKIAEEIAKKKNALSSSKKIDYNTLALATTYPGGFNNLSPEQRKNVIAQFGGIEQLARQAIERATGKCALYGTPHLCYAPSQNAATYDTIPLSQHYQIALEQRDEVLRELRRCGVC